MSSGARAMTMLAAAVGTFAGEGVEDLTSRAATLGDPATATDDRGRCCALLLSGFVHWQQGRLAEAAARFRTAFVGCDPGDDPDLRGNLGVAAMVLGDAD